MNCIEGIFQGVTLSRLNWIGLIPWYHDFFLKTDRRDVGVVYSRGSRWIFSPCLVRRKSLIDCNLGCDTFEKPQLFTFRADWQKNSGNPYLHVEIFHYTKRRRDGYLTTHHSLLDVVPRQIQQTQLWRCYSWEAIDRKNLCLPRRCMWWDTGVTENVMKVHLKEQMKFCWPTILRRPCGDNGNARYSLLIGNAPIHESTWRWSDDCHGEPEVAGKLTGWRHQTHSYSRFSEWISSVFSLGKA